MKQTKEYLSILQFLLYKAQKRQKSKKIISYQKIFCKSNSLILHILCNKSFSDVERINFHKSLSHPVFQNMLKIFILKKEMQLYSFFNSKLKLNKNQTLINIIETGRAFSASFDFFIDFRNKEICYLDFIFYSYFMKLSYVHFLDYFLEGKLWKINQNIFLTKHVYSFFFLFLQKNNFLFYDIIKIRLLRKTKIYFLIGPDSLLFNYQIFNFFFTHNLFVYVKKIAYKNLSCFDLVSNKKYLFFFIQNNKTKIQFYKTIKLLKKICINVKNKFLKNTYYSTIYDFSCIRKNYSIFDFYF